MDKKISLLILFGGMSSEHEVSRVSAASVLEHIDTGKYEINTIGITKEGNWFLTGSPAVHIRDGSWEQDNSNRRALLSPDRSSAGLFAENERGRGWRQDGNSRAAGAGQPPAVQHAGAGPCETKQRHLPRHRLYPRPPQRKCVHERNGGSLPSEPQLLLPPFQPRDWGKLCELRQPAED